MPTVGLDATTESGGFENSLSVFSPFNCCSIWKAWLSFWPFSEAAARCRPLCTGIPSIVSFPSGCLDFTSGVNLFWWNWTAGLFLIKDWTLFAGSEFSLSPYVRLVIQSLLKGTEEGRKRKRIPCESQTLLPSDEQKNQSREHLFHIPQNQLWSWHISALLAVPGPGGGRGGYLALVGVEVLGSLGAVEGDAPQRAAAEPRLSVIVAQDAENSVSLLRAVATHHQPPFSWAVALLQKTPHMRT